MPAKGNFSGTDPARSPTLGNAAVVSQLMTPEVIQPVIHMVDDQRRVMNRVWMGAGVVVGSGLVFLAIRGLVRNARYKSAISKTDDTQQAANFAQRIYNAFNPDTAFGWGTDEELLRRTIKEIPHRKFWNQVKTEYNKLTKGGNLLEDMSNELSRHQKQEIDLILQALPANKRQAMSHDPGLVSSEQMTAWAKRIKLAADYESSFLWPYGTDEDAIYEVIKELPNVSTLCALNSLYYRMHGKSFFAELTSEMEGADLSKAYTHIKEIPDAKGKTISEIIASCNY